jgi:hypothetical protein
MIVHHRLKHHRFLPVRGDISTTHLRRVVRKYCGVSIVVKSWVLIVGVDDVDVENCVRELRWGTLVLRVKTIHLVT